MAVYKKDGKPKYTVIDNTVINNKKLSFKSRMILIYLLSKPNTWKVRIGDIVKSSDKDGLDAVKSGMKELVVQGHAVLRKGSMKDKENNTYIGSYYDIYEDPEDDRKIK